MRHCQTCGQRHEPPTGAKCQRRDQVGNNTDSSLQELLRALTSKVDNLEKRLPAPTGPPDGLDPENQATLAAETSPPIRPETENWQAPEMGSGPSNVAPQSHTAHTLASLRADATLRAAIDRRFTDLLGVEVDMDGEAEDDEEPPLKLLRGNKCKSGQVKTALDTVVKKIDWPHFHVFRAGSSKSVKYTDLTLAEFVYGYCSQMSECKDPNQLMLMIKHLQELMEDTSDFSWDRAKAFHAIVLNKFEQNKLNWQNREEIQYLRRKHAQRVEAAPPTGQATKANGGNGVKSSRRVRADPGTKACVAYNKGSCKEPGDHGDLLHICSFCLKANNVCWKHPEKSCNKRANNDSKNY